MPIDRICNNTLILIAVATKTAGHPAMAPVLASIETKPLFAPATQDDIELFDRALDIAEGVVS